MKRYGKGTKRRYSIYFIILILIISSIFYSSFTNIKQIIQNKKETKNYAKQYDSLLKKRRNFK